MIDLYTHGTANGRKPAIMLEETGLTYNTHIVGILDGAQFEADFIAMNPNAKIPVIVDSNGPDGEPFTVFESGAILWYLAEVSDSPLLSKDFRTRGITHQWMMFQMANIGPMFGQYHHFHSHAPERVPYAHKRYRKEVERLYSVMNSRLETSAFLASDDYSIADIATFTWVDRFESPEIDFQAENWPAVARWHREIASRPAVQRGMNLG